jgi:hypothetical protein
MTHTHRRLVHSVAIVATLAGAATQGPAQLTAQDAFVSLAVTAQPSAAARMEQQARELLLTGHGWEQAADLYLRAAELRGAGDLESADNLRLAGYVEFYRGRPKAAVASLTQAGETFLALGDVERAAQAFIDGAWVAAQASMPIEARALHERGRLLTQSPLLAAEDRTALVRRLGGVPAIE